MKTCFQTPIVLSVMIGALLCLPLFAHDQSTITVCRMTPALQDALGRMEVTKSTNEVHQVLLSIENGSERATQLLLAVIQTDHAPDCRSDLASLLFKQELSDQGINVSHIPLLTRLYLSSVVNPAPRQPRPRTFIEDSTLQSRLLDMLGTLLNVEQERAKLAGGEPIARLRALLEAAALSSTLSANGRGGVTESLRMIEMARFPVNNDQTR